MGQSNYGANKESAPLSTTMIIRRNFEEQLSELQEDLLRLGRFVEEAHAKGMDSLVRGDLALAKQVINDDDFADDMTFGIQARATQLLALQQPMARDLRFVASCLKIVVDLERIGDHACDIGKVTRSLAGQGRPPAELPQLSGLARKMVGDALQCFVQHDTKQAIQVARDDDAVDDLCDQVQRDMIDLMRTDSSRVESATRYLLVARSLERVADHATNIAEQVYYVETGEWRNLAREEHNHALLSSLGLEEDEWRRIQGKKEEDTQ
ncbi:phosphate signaling complex protein PhoU [bacterium]|nr:MAG: phosphate signaling complex protein PhoU [bacterium]